MMLGFFHCHWYVTTRCNSRCKTCSIWSDRTYKCSESSLKDRLELLPQIKKLGCISIDFTGGEPLLYKDLPVLIKSAHKMGFFTSLTTNGTLYRRYAEDLRGNVSALSFSLDAADARTHNAIRGINCFNSVVKSIILARKLGETVMLKTTVCNDYMDQIPPLLKFAARYGILIELNAEFSYFDNPRLTNKNIKRMFNWNKHPNVIISNAHLHFMLDGGNNIDAPICPINKKVLVLSPDNGIYYPCMHYVQNIIPIFKNNLIETIESDEFKMQMDMPGRFWFCENCTIPCYFESDYYTRISKYLPICLYSRIGYLKKRFIVEMKNKFN